MCKTPLIFFAVPIRNRAWCLDEYLNGLLSFDYPKSLIQLYFLVNDSTDATKSKLIDFYYRLGRREYYDCTFEEIHPGAPMDNRTAAVTHKLYPHFADLKNQVRENFLLSGCDYWMQIDSDNPPQRDTLRKMLRHREGYVAGTCNVSRKPGERLSNVMVCNGNSYRRAGWAEMEATKPGGLFMADWVGGIVLIRRDVAAACHYHVVTPGRDDTLGFCREAQGKGWGIYVDPEVRLEHFMTAPEKPTS